MPGPSGKRAPYGKRGLNQGVLATTNGVLDNVIGLSPFGIYCQGCKTKIAFSTFKNHIRDAHSECFTPQAVNYAAVSREYERLVAERKDACRDFEQYVTGDVCDRFQCTSCFCLFDNKSNAKRHFLSMKTGCSDASLTIVKCRKTICYRAVTLVELERLIQEAKKKKQLEEGGGNGGEEEEAEEGNNNTAENNIVEEEEQAEEKEKEQQEEKEELKAAAENGEEDEKQDTTTTITSSSKTKKSNKRSSPKNAEKKMSKKSKPLPVKKEEEEEPETAIDKEEEEEPKQVVVEVSEKDVKQEEEDDDDNTNANAKKEEETNIKVVDKTGSPTEASPTGTRKSGRVRKKRRY